MRQKGPNGHSGGGEGPRFSKVLRSTRACLTSRMGCTTSTRWDETRRDETSFNGGSSLEGFGKVRGSGNGGLQTLHFSFSINFLVRRLVLLLLLSREEGQRRKFERG